MTDILTELARKAATNYAISKGGLGSDYYTSGAHDDEHAVQISLTALRAQQAMIVEWVNNVDPQLADQIEQGAYLKGRG